MNKTRWIGRCVAAAATALALGGATSAVGAVDMFLKLDGIPGEALAKGHEKEIDILTLSWDVSPRSGTLNGTSRACAHDISLTKYLDKATPLLLANAVAAATIPKATLTMRQAGPREADFFFLEFTQVQVTSVNHGATAGAGGPMEQITLQAATIKVTFRPQKADGSLDAPIVTTITRNNC
jgi:type VI secretion system secreted protein Hcp